MDVYVSPVLPGSVAFTPRMPAMVPFRAPLPRVRGAGHLAGDSPGGTATVQGAPTEAEIRVIYRPASGSPGDGAVVATTRSAQDGTWRVDGLDTAAEFDVVARLGGYNDVIVSQVRPATP